MTQTLTWDEMRLYEGAHGDEWCGKQCAVEVSNLIAAGIVTPPPGLLRCERPLEPAPFGDDHPSISRVVRAYVIGLNDAWDDGPRQRLLPYTAKILCTATGPEDEERRAWMVIDWLVRVHAPAFLRLAGLEDHARALEGLARIADATLARAAQPTIDAARKDADATWAAAGVAAWDAAVDAAWDAARVAEAAAARVAEAAAARDAAAGVAAWDAAADAAVDAAWDAARVAAWAAARVAARAAAADAAGDAARDAARAAAGDAAWDALAPTVAALQDSALVLLDEMIALDARKEGQTDG